MKHTKRPITLLMAEDDPEDLALVCEAFEEAKTHTLLKVVRDGEELLTYLQQDPPYEDAGRPDVILLDLNMPKKSGHECLSVIKSDPALRSIPVIILTSSSAEEDIVSSYELGVNSYIRKPITFGSLVKIVRSLGEYWFEVVELPPT